MSTTTSGTNRYADAYVVAQTIEGVGMTIKAIGILVGTLLALASLASATQGGVGVVFALMGIAVAGTIAAVLFLLGILASAHGQLLKATLDIAVNTSRLPSDQDRAPGTAFVLSAPQVGWRCGCGQTNPAAAPACLECGVRYGGA